MAVRREICYSKIVVRERKLWGDARPSPYRVLSVAPGRRVWRARRRRMVMNEAASAPVVSATSSETPTLLERASGRRRTARRTRRRSRCR